MANAAPERTRRVPDAILDIERIRELVRCAAIHSLASKKSRLRQLRGPKASRDVTQLRFELRLGLAIYLRRSPSFSRRPGE